MDSVPALVQVTGGPPRSPSSRPAISKDREVTASHHGDMPYFGKAVTSVLVALQASSVDEKHQDAPPTQFRSMPPIMPPIAPAPAASFVVVKKGLCSRPE